MIVDSLRGRGAYRCSCGSRVVITMPPPPKNRCVATHNDEPCRFVPEVTFPLPLCTEHFTSTGLRQYADWMNLQDDKLAYAIAFYHHRFQTWKIESRRDILAPVNADFLDQWAHHTVWTRGLVPFTDEQREEMRRRHAEEPERHEREGVVYFVRSGDHVKIGTTLHINKRFGEIQAPNTELLATEPGYLHRESLLHSKFAKFRANGEWFRLEPALVRYINALRNEAGQPPIAA